MLGQWVLEMNHVAAMVGGFNSQQKIVGQDGVAIHADVPRTAAGEAVQFLNDNAFATPALGDQAGDPAPHRAGRRARPHQDGQMRVLNTLLSGARFARLVEQEAIDGAAAYRPTEFLADVRRGIWRELEADHGADRCLPAQPAARVSRR